ncbi:hypothetical protein AB3M89_09890 [Microbacterium sp. 179-I 3D2 NHS]|uniref:hypothetical protein n=1 Tax=Microbacterium sp. 179-I 3D2 NHS TaxID=3235178 RepID=UPI0039A0FF07
MSIRSACWYRHGDQVSVDLSSDAEPWNRYVAQLVRTGVRRAVWWQFGDAALVLVVHGDPIPSPPTSMALHVVPVGWVSDRRLTPPKKMPPLDLSWSWADVVALADVTQIDG